MAWLVFSEEDLNQAATPDNPAKGFFKIYIKPDGFLYILDWLGDETYLSNANEDSGKTYATTVVLSTIIGFVTITHNLGSSDVLVQGYNTATGYYLDIDVISVDNNNVQVQYISASDTTVRIIVQS